GLGRRRDQPPDGPWDRRILPARRRERGECLAGRRAGIGGRVNGYCGGGSVAVHLRAVWRNRNDRCGERQSLPVHGAGERRHRTLLLPRAVLPSWPPAVHL